MFDAITDVPGLRVGHAHDREALTGCTVLLCEAGAVGGVDQRGGAPGTRETDPLNPLHLVERVHAVVLSGGSAFGLDAAGGVVRYLEERGVGFPVGPVRVPIVPAAILFDLGIGRSDVRPDAQMGYQACLNASGGPVEQGNVGAGTGASAGKAGGIERAVKTGIGAASQELAGRVIVGGLAAVNPFGDVFDPHSGKILAGTRRLENDPAGDGSPFADTLRVLTERLGQPPPGFNQPANTVIGIVATNATLNKTQATKIAQMAHDGLARTIRPAHTMFDGDTIFALATCEKPAGSTPFDVNIIGACAAEVFARAIINAVMAAQAAGGLPAARDLL